MSQSKMWEDEKTDAILGNLLPQKEPEAVPEKPPPLVEPVPVTTPKPEERTT